MSSKPPGPPHQFLKSSVAMTIAFMCGVVFTMLIHQLEALSDGEPASLLQVANQIVDLGELAPGEKQDVSFSIVNKGNKRLVINELNDGCCDNTRPRRSMIILPNSSVDLVVDIEMSTEPGDFEKSTIFSTSDPIQPRLELLVKGSVRSRDVARESNPSQRPLVSVLIKENP